jgi:hypothetical protein
MRWDEHVDIVTPWEVTREQRILFGDSVSNTTFRKPIPIRDNNIKMEFYNLKKMRGYGMVLFGSE